MTEQEAIEEIRSCLGVNNIIMPYSDEMDAFGMAIKALEKQVPKKPIEQRNDDWTSWWYECPDCNMMIYRKTNYCERCGQALKWK